MSGIRKITSEKINFYTQYYHVVIKTLNALVFIVLVLGCFVMYQVFHRPLPHFSAVNANGQNMSLVPLVEPNLLPDTLLKWASKAAVAAYTFDFVNYDKQINLARPYFTDAGWNDYQNSISALIASIRQKQLFVNGVVAGAPIIASQGESLGSGYTWRVQIPFLVTYQSSEETKQTSFLVMLTIVKVSTLKNPTGIGIDQFVMV
jgi:intracellular multiplication protein IcmL